MTTGAGGGLFGASLGTNFVTRKGDYVGPFIGVANAADARIYTAGGRLGHRPHSNIGIRPEARAEILWDGNESVFSLSVLVGLESR